MAGGAPVRVLLDANVLVAAIRNPRRRTATFRLLTYFLTSEPERLVANDLLVEEYLRYAQVFPSPTARALVAALLRRMETIGVEEQFVRACAPYFPRDEVADIVHAATCLKTRALLVSNDRHFRRIRQAGIVKVLTLAEAIRRWLPPVGVGEMAEDEDLP